MAVNGALQVWAGNTDLSGNSNSLYNLDQNGYTKLGTTNAQNTSITFSTGGVQYNYFVIVSRGKVQVDAVQGSDSSYLTNVDSTGSTSDNGTNMTGAPDGSYTTIGTNVSDGAFAGYAEFANPNSWTSVTVTTGSMGVMLSGQISHQAQYFPGVSSPYNQHAEIHVDDNGLITSAEVRNPSGVWYPLTLDGNRGSRNAQWAFNYDYSSMANLTAAFPNGTYTFVANSAFGTTTTRFSYTMATLGQVLTPVGLINGSTGVSTNLTVNWNAVSNSGTLGGIDFEVDGPNGQGTLVDGYGLPSSSTNYGPIALAASSNYAMYLSLDSGSPSTNADGFQFSVGATNRTSLLFRTAGTAAGAPQLNFTALGLPAGTAHPGDWIMLPVTGGNAGGNAIGISGGIAAPIVYQAVLGTTPTWGAPGNIFLAQNSIGDPGMIGGESFSGGQGGGPTVQIPFSVAPGTYYVGLKLDPTGVLAGNIGNTTIWSSTQITISANGTIAIAPPSTQTAAAGVSQAFDLGSFTQANATAPFMVDVNWGDGSRDSIFPVASAGTIPAAAHTYANQGSNTVTVTVSDWGGEASKTATFKVAVPGAVTHFAVSAPTSAAAGSASSVTVTACDAYNNKITNYNGTVHFTSTDQAAILPADAALTNGTGTSSVTFTTAGSQTVTATDIAAGTIIGSSVISVSPGAAMQFVVTAPASVSAGAATSVTVAARDAYNNKATGYTGTVHFTSSDATAILPADAKLTNGKAIFSVTFKTAGNQTVTATDTVTGATTGLSGVVNVAPAAVARFKVSAIAPVTAGVATSFTVTARDAYNNIVTGYTGRVHFSSSDAAVVLRANATLTGGTGTFNVTFTTAGSQTVSVNDTLTGSIIGMSSAVSVAAGAATRFVVSAPVSTTAGGATSITVTARDAFNNKATGYTGTVHFSSSDASAVLPADATLTNGRGIFSVTLKTAGSQTVTATDTVTNSITGASSSVSVTPGVTTHFTVTAPASVTKGIAASFTVTARDAYNNKVTSYAGTVHFSTALRAILPADSILVIGKGIFSVTFQKVGSQTLTVSDGLNSGIATVLVLL